MRWRPNPFAKRPFSRPRAADWLCLAAAPAFAITALLTGVLGGGQPDIRCSAEHTSPLDPDVLADERLPFAALAEADL
jgi:hypothetical protein